MRRKGVGPERDRKIVRDGLDLLRVGIEPAVRGSVYVVRVETDHAAVPADELTDAADELVTRLAAGPTVAIGLAKQALAYGQSATLAQSMNQELSNLELSCRTADFKEGLAAFLERRAPTWHHGTDG